MSSKTNTNLLRFRGSEGRSPSAFAAVLPGLSLQVGEGTILDRRRILPVTSKYDHYSKEELVRIIEERDRKPRLGLVWEQDEIDTTAP